MKHTILLLLAFLFAGHTVVNAQNGGGQRRSAEERTKRTLERLTPDLSLSQEQQGKLTPVFTDFYNGMSKLREDASGGRPDRSAFQKLATERDEKVKGILNEEQFKKYTTAMENMRKRGGGRPGGNR
jgi:hypothetical protein